MAESLLIRLVAAQDKFVDNIKQAAANALGSQVGSEHSVFQVKKTKSCHLSTSSVSCRITYIENSFEKKQEKIVYFLFIADLISYSRSSYFLSVGFNIAASLASLNALW